MDDPQDQEDLYRIQILQAFEVEQWDDDIINNEIEQVLSKISSSDDFKTILDKARTNKNILEILAGAELSNTEDSIIFKMLFTYDYFDVLHRCICDILINGTVSKPYLDKLLNIL